jgi:hypothetical protein
MQIVLLSVEKPSPNATFEILFLTFFSCAQQNAPCLINAHDRLCAAAFACRFYRSRSSAVSFFTVNNSCKQIM